MSNTDGAHDGKAGKARHGPRSEVNWEGGSGRQPYANQVDEQAVAPDSGAEVAEGDRGEESGRNQEQLEQARGTPGRP